MRSLRNRNIESKPAIKNSNPNVDDSSSSPRKNKVDASDDKQFGNRAPFEDIFQNNDEFDTQIMDFDAETQPIFFEDETQELSCETQVIDDGVDDCDEHMDTQMLDISDNEGCECTSDRKGVESTETCGDPVGSVDVELQNRNGNKTAVFDAGETLNCCREDGGAGSGSGSMFSDDVAPSSGSVRKGFASDRTASIQAGLVARQTALKNADSGSSEPHLLDDCSKKSNVETVGGETDIEENELERLSDGDKSNVARPLARKLFMEGDVAEIESDDSFSDRREESSQLPSRDNDVAGLSYVDSQEPGELSQANALDFVDRFLKINVFKSDDAVMQKKAVAELVSPGAIAKGAQSIAQQASRKSTLAEASVYEWDDNLEDEGGGEFFIKKKELLYGTPKSCPKPRNSRHRELRENQSHGKLQNEKLKQNLHKAMTIFHSDSKLAKGGVKGKVKEKDMEKKVKNVSGQHLGLGSCSQEALVAVQNAQTVDIHDVGIDTQMAAEAMEALAAVTTLANNDISMADQGCYSERDLDQNKANGPSKQCSSHQKRSWLSTSGIVTRSRGKRTKKTYGLFATANFDVGLVNSKTTENKSCMDNLPAEPSEIGSVRVGGKKTKSFLGQLNTNPPQPVKRQSLRKRASTFTPFAQQSADYASGGSGELRCMEVVHERNCRTRNNVISENMNHNNESLDRTTIADCNKVDESNCSNENIQCTSSQDDCSIDKGCRLSSGKGPEITMEFIAQRTRSRSNTAQCAEIPGDENVMLSFKQDLSSTPEKGTLGSARIDGSHGNLQKSYNPDDITPVNLKTPRSAVSPICLGDGYQTPSCKKRLSLTKEFSNLTSSEQRCNSPYKGLRQRRDMNTVRVLFSQHLDDDTVRQQKKILSRLGVSVASSISEATHFVADKFARTRNMLEAIAYAKPVVTHLWLESCGQANCFISEKNYILRDAKKEKELGFNMPRSLAHASRYPLLEGKRVLITQNAKPGKEVISNLVKAVHGQPVERLGRSIPNNDDLLVISCEDDFEDCVPLLEKEISIYSSELLLNGIITQRLEYERYRLFVAHLKKTRSTLWLKKGGEKFVPVAKI